MVRRPPVEVRHNAMDAAAAGKASRLGGVRGARYHEQCSGLSVDDAWVTVR